MADDKPDRPENKQSLTGYSDLLPTGEIVGRRRFLAAAGALAGGSILTTSAAAASGPQTLEIVSTEQRAEQKNSLEVTYEFTATGLIEPQTGSGDNAAEGNDSVTQNADGTYTATGKTGNGFGDTFTVEGNVVDFSASDAAFELYLDGSQVSVDELVQQAEHVIEVISTADPSELTYTFTTSGEIRPYTDNGENSAEDNDTITQNSDGTWSVDGYTGNGYGDGFYFDGSLESFDWNGEPVEVLVDGSTVDLSQFQSGPDHHLEIVSTADPGELDYGFTTTEEITPDTDNGENSAEDNDSITQNSDGTWSVDGYTGNGYGDAFYFNGEVTDFSPMEGAFELYLDGSLVTAYDLTGEEQTSDSDSDSTSSDSPNIGGGDGYANTVPESDADVVVSSLDELRSAFDGASSGDVIYVAGDAVIDVGTNELTIPSGITLASDRGIDGAAGGRIETTSLEQWPGILHVEDDVRVTGLRINGPADEFESSFDPITSGLVVDGTGVEIDNVDIWGFNHAAIKLHNSTHVHHCNVHDNPMDGLGYGVLCKGGDESIVEYNRFNMNRHSVANGGSAGYVVRYNRFGSDAVSYQVGTHRPGGTTLKIHHNTFEPVEHYATNGDHEPNICIRGTPSDVADIHHNWCYNPVEPRDSPSDWTDEAIIQVHVDEWTNVTYSDNAYGSDQPSSDDIGCP
jgi:hypothetical protein